MVQIQPKIWRVALHMFKTGQHSVPSHSGLYIIQYIFRTVYGTNLGSVWRQNGNMLMSKSFAVQPVAITGSHFGLQFITDFSIHITLMSIILPIAPPEEWKVHTLGTCYWLHREGKWMPIIIQHTKLHKIACGNEWKGWKQIRGHRTMHNQVKQYNFFMSPLMINQAVGDLYHKTTCLHHQKSFRTALLMIERNRQVRKCP